MNAPRFDSTVTLGQLLTMISVLIGALSVGGAGVGVWVSLNNSLASNTAHISDLEGSNKRLQGAVGQLADSMKELVERKITDARQEVELRNLGQRIAAVETRVSTIENIVRPGNYRSPK